MARFTSTHGLLITAFISGFAMLAYELVVARLLAPSIGSSTYVWTSVIGTVIAALALGYWVGGIAADTRKRASDVAWLCLLSALAIVWTLAANLPILELVARIIPDARFQGIIAALVLCAPASFLLGALSPYLGKLRVTSLETSGRSIASLGALNSLGGITGTFITGFVLFSIIGSRESLLVLIILLVTVSWLSVPKVMWRPRLGLSVVLLAASLLLLPAYTPNAVAIDTASAHYQIVDRINKGVQTRLLSAGPADAQSGISLDNPDELIFWYTSQLADIVAKTPEQSNILVLGGGAFTLPSYLARTYPDSRVTAVEIDDALPAISRHYFNLKDRSNLKIFTKDARAYLNQTTDRYDIIIADVYNGTSIPFSLATAEYAAALAPHVAPGGIVAVNVIGAFEGRCAAVADRLSATYRSQFGYGQYVKEAADPTRASNMIFVYGKSPLAYAGFLALPSPDVLPYTDNYAPVEPDQLRCIGV